MAKPETKKEIVAVEDKEMFDSILNGIIETWDLKKPVDLMVANRMASTCLKILQVDAKVKQFGVYYKTTDCNGNTHVKVNELCYYLKQLESEFRSYYRMIQSKTSRLQGNTKEIPDFATWIETAKVKK